MKKVSLLNILIILLGIFILGFGFIVCDCIRLQNSEIGTKPLIVVSESYSERGITYEGLGYEVTYLCKLDDNTDYSDERNKESLETIVSTGYGAEFELFDNFLIWAWIE